MDVYIHSDRVTFHSHQSSVAPSGDVRLSHRRQADAYKRRWVALSALFSFARDRLQHNQEYNDAAVLTRKDRRVFNYINSIFYLLTTDAVLVVEHPLQYLWKNAKIRGPKKPTKEHLLDPFAVKARRAMAAFAAPPSRGAAVSSPTGSQAEEPQEPPRRKRKKKKKTKRTADQPAADGEPPALTR